MTTTTAQQSSYVGTATAEGARANWRDARYQAFALMRLTFTIAPIAFGLDKFFNVMVDWPIYLAPWINDIARTSCTSSARPRSSPASSSR
jgi:hypothetical protein